MSDTSHSPGRLSRRLIVIGLAGLAVVLCCVCGSRPPTVPAIRASADTCSPNAVCTLYVASWSSDGSSVSYQFDLRYLGNQHELLEWSNYFPSGDTVGLPFQSDSGVYGFKARAQDEQGSISDFCPEATVVIANAAPGQPDVPEGESWVFADLTVPYRTRANEPEYEDVQFRVDPGGGDTISSWSPLQSCRNDYVFTCCFAAAGTRDVRVQARDVNGHVSNWSLPRQVTVEENLEQLGSLGIPGGASSVVSRGDYVFAGSPDHGVQVVDLTSPSSPQLVGGFGSFDASVMDRDTSHHLFVLAKPNLILYALDISDPANPQTMDTMHVADGQSLGVAGATAALGTGWFAQKLVLVDVGSPGSLVQLSTLPLAQFYDIAVQNSEVFALVTGSPAVLHCVDIGNRAAPYVKGSVQVGAGRVVAAPGEGYVYVAGTDSLRVVDVRDPAQPLVVRTLALHGTAKDVDADGRFLAVGLGSDGVAVYSLSNPQSPVLAGRLDTYDAKGVSCGGDRLLVADGSGGLLIFAYPTFTAR